MQAAVLGRHEGQIIVPDHNVTMVSVDSLDEAHYLCAVLNSDIASMFVMSYITWFYSTHILEYFQIPKFQRGEETHEILALLSKRAHRASNSDKLSNIVHIIEDQINREVRNMPVFRPFQSS
jgi:hypothetical protein